MAADISVTFFRQTTAHSWLFSQLLLASTGTVWNSSCHTLPVGQRVAILCGRRPDACVGRGFAPSLFWAYAYPKTTANQVQSKGTSQPCTPPQWHKKDSHSKHRVTHALFLMATPKHPPDSMR